MRIGRWDSSEPYRCRTWLRGYLPWFLISLGVAGKGDNCEAVGGIHEWYNLNDSESACYHCTQVREGQLWNRASADENDQKTKQRLEQYCVVRIRKLNRDFAGVQGSFNRRPPQVGDVATVVEVYEQPCLGYELECSDQNGITEWLITFSPDDADFETVRLSAI